MIAMAGVVWASGYVACFPERLWWVDGFPSWATDFGFCWEEAT